MSKWLIDDSTLIDIADAVREKRGTSEPIQVNALADEIALINGGQYPTYAGPTEVTPQVNNFVTLNTSNTTVMSNIIVNKIPSQEVSNSGGGVTFIIGG